MKKQVETTCRDSEFWRVYDFRFGRIVFALVGTSGSTCYRAK